jgi:signal peptidase II
VSLSAKIVFALAQPQPHLLQVKRLLPKNSKETRQAVLFALVGVFLLIADIILKQHALESLPEITSPTGPFFDFALYKNPGVAFSAPIPLPVVALVTGVAILALTRTLVVEYRTRPLVAVGALFMLFGATSNLVDRLVHGFTVDYLVIFSRSVINFSDILILLGLFLLLRYYQSIPSVK